MVSIPSSAERKGKAIAMKLKKPPFENRLTFDLVQDKTPTFYECRDVAGNLHFRSDRLASAGAYADAWNQGTRRAEQVKIYEQVYKPFGAASLITVSKATKPANREGGAK